MAILDLYNTSIFSNLPTTPRSRPTVTQQAETKSLPKIGFNQATPQSFNFSPDTGRASTTLSIQYNNTQEALYNSWPRLQPGDEQPYVVVRPNDPNIRIKQADNRAVPAGSVIQDVERIGKFLTSTRGLQFVAKQFFLQSFQPTIETKIWNPLSVPIALLPYVYPDRHASVATLGKILNVATLFSGLGGISNNLSQFDFSTYGGAVFKLPLDGQGRNIYQSPLRVDYTSEYPGQKFADLGRSYMTNKDNFKYTDPNRYLYPIGNDGAGLPLVSGRPSTYEEMEMKTGLANIAEKYTKATGWNPTQQSEQVTSLQSGIIGALKNLIPESVRRPVAQALNIVGGIDDPTAPQIKYFSRYNSTFKYLLNSNFSKDNKSPVLRVVNESEDQSITFDDGTSPLTETLESLVTIGIYKAATTVPFSFINQGTMETTIAEVTDDRLTDEGLKQYKSQDQLPDYLQSYGEMASKRTSAQEGGLDISFLRGGRDVKTYQQEKEEEGIYIHSLYGIANPGAKNKEGRTPDKISMLDYGDNYGKESNNPDLVNPELDDFIPFKFYHINLNKWIVFRATINGLNESVNPQWNPKKYIGRVDQVYTYSGAERRINFSFTIHPNSAQELKPLWRKLNYLIGLCYPNYRTLSENRGQFMVGPFTRLTIGDMYKNMPGLIESLTITFPDEGTWEIRNGTVVDGQGNEVDVSRLPRYVQVTVGYIIIGHSRYSSTSLFYDADVLKQ